MNRNPRPIKLKDISFRKTKTFTDEEKHTIIEFYNTHTMYETCLKFFVQPGAIKRWTDPKYKEQQRITALKYKNNWTDEQKEKRKQYRQNRYKQQKELEKAYQKQYNETHVEYLQYRRRIWYNKHKNDPILYEQMREKSRKLEQKWSKTPIYKLKSHIRSYVTRCFQINDISKLQSSVEYIGCSINELKEHIEMQFLKDMSWDNIGIWHIDHIIPLAIISDKYDLEEQAKFLCNYENLQPMWGYENNIKHDKILFENKLQSIRTCRNDVLHYIEVKFKKPYFQCTHKEIIHELQIITNVKQ